MLLKLLSYLSGHEAATMGAQTTAVNILTDACQHVGLHYCSLSWFLGQNELSCILLAVQILWTGVVVFLFVMQIIF